MALKRIKKRWREVYGLKPIEKYLGEIYVATPEDMVGRRLILNLSSLTNNYKHQHINVKFEVIKTEGEKGYAEIFGYYLQQAYKKRIVRKNREKVGDSFAVYTKDKKLVVIKPIIITNSSCSRAVKSAIRKKAREYFKKVKKMNYTDFFDELIKGKFTLELKKELSKIMPISTIEYDKVYRANNFAIILE